ncbi:MAG: helix-turn-helix domain-containing protein, partial [Muribaculaceae bacterium]|nr:helix-turn-helix domain-containing protein [Muribaculaceae bacterium]
LGLIMRLQGDIRELQRRLADDAPAPAAAAADTFVEVPGALHHHLPVKIDEVHHIDLSPATREATSLDDTERRAIEDALERNMGRRKAAAGDLGISERTLYRKIKEYGLE